MTLGEKISKLRKNKSLTQEELGNEMSVSRQAIQKWESNASLPDVYKLKLLADFFCVTVDYFLKDNEEMPSENIDNVLENEIHIKNDVISEFIQTITDVISTINGFDFININYSNSSDDIIQYNYGNNKNDLLDSLIIDSKYLLTKGITYQFIFKLLKFVFFRNIYKETNNNQNKLVEYVREVNLYSSYLSQKIMVMLFDFKTISCNYTDADLVVLNNMFEEKELYYTRLIENMAKLIKVYKIDFSVDNQLECTLDIDLIMKKYNQLENVNENKNLKSKQEEVNRNDKQLLTPQKKDKGILPKIFFVISCIFSIFVGLSYAYMGLFSYYAFSLLWKIPMTIYVFYAYNKNIEIKTFFKVCSFIFISPFAGITLFKSNKGGNR